MSLKLYGLGPSRSFRCLWALCEADVEFEYVPVVFDVSGPTSAKSSSYLAKNSQGKVPTLEHGNFIVTESAAIVNYINTLTDQTFIPASPKNRARYDQLSYFILTELEQPLWTNGKHRFALPEEHRVAEILPTAKFEFDKALKTLEELTPLKPYALGGTFTFADVLLAQTVHWAIRFEFDVPQRYVDYRDKLFERDAAKRAWEIVGD